MAEYGRKQRNKLNRAVANNGGGSKQLKKLTDNRVAVINQFQLLKSHQMNSNSLQYKVIQRAWNENHPGPEDFTNESAQHAVEHVDFSQSIYVNISAGTGYTKKAFAYYQIGNWIICVVGDVHNHWGQHPQYDEPGNSYIPGWDNWQMQTPAAAVPVINNLPPRGQFPGANRYPHQIEHED